MILIILAVFLFLVVFGGGSRLMSDSWADWASMWVVVIGISALCVVIAVLASLGVKAVTP